MLKWVTVEFIGMTNDGEHVVELSDYHNERTGVRRVAHYRMSVTAERFAELATDHGLTPADFPMFRPVRVSELA